MKKQLMIAVLAALSSAATVGFAKERERPALPALPAPERGEKGGRGEADKALRDYYGPTAQFKITHDEEVNGVKVYDAVVTRDGAEAEASVTHSGHLVVTGLPQQINVIAAGAQATSQLFRATQSVTQEEVHGYWVVITAANNKPFIIQFDAAGRIRDIKSTEQLREDNPGQNLKVTGPAEHQMREMAERRFSGVQIDAVDNAMHDPGYYQVGFKNQYGQGWAIMNAQNDVTEWRMPIDRKELPEPVQKAIARDLHGDRIVRISRGSERVYRLVQDIAGEQVIMQVKPDGAVVWLNTRALHPHH